MKLFKRNIPLSVVAQKLGTLLIVTIRITILFKNPMHLLYHYIRSNALPEKVVTLRNGKKIFLSSNASDLITVIVLFGKREYGDIPKLATILDIGANIGVFCIYAKVNGADKVFACEPNEESYTILMKNIKENGYEDTVMALNRAVTSIDGETVLIPKESSPMNQILESHDDEHTGLCRVKTISLESILRKYSIEFVDLLKIDCEGSEYQIIEATGAEIFNKIKRLRFEYHEGPDDLTHHLSKYGYRVDGHFPDNASGGGRDKVGRIFYSNYS